MAGKARSGFPIKDCSLTVTDQLQAIRRNLRNLGSELKRTLYSPSHFHKEHPAMRFRPLGTVCVCIGLLVTLAGCGGGSKSSSPSSSVTPPVIKTHPTNQTVAPGQSATFTASASGGGPLTYQWQKDGAA